jgi:hypothetical protein
VDSTAVSVVAGAVSSTAGVSVTAVSSATGAGEVSFLGTSGAISLLVLAASLPGPVKRWKLPEIRRDHPLLGRLVSSPESAPSSSDVTASGAFA